MPFQNLAELLTKKKADTQWLLQGLYALDNTHRVFAPDYVYVKPRHSLQTIANPLRLISNQDGFFEGLPEQTSKRGKRNTAFRITKAER